MGIKTFRPYTPSRRNMTTLTNDEITKKLPEKSLLDTKKKNAGIHLITVKIKEPANELEIAKIKKDLIAEYEIEESKINVIIK